MSFPIDVDVYNTRALRSAVTNGKPVWLEYSKPVWKTVEVVKAIEQNTAVPMRVDSPTSSERYTSASDPYNSNLGTQRNPIPVDDRGTSPNLHRPMDVDTNHHGASPRHDNPPASAPAYALSPGDRPGGVMAERTSHSEEIGMDDPTSKSFPPVKKGLNIDALRDPHRTSPSGDSYRRHGTNPSKASPGGSPSRRPPADTHMEREEWKDNSRSTQSMLPMDYGKTETDSKATSTSAVTSADGTEKYPPFTHHMSFDAAEKLKVGDWLDHRDDVGKSLSSQVVRKDGTTLTIHYDGWAEKWDANSDYCSDLWRFAPHKEISFRQSYRFSDKEIGDYIDVFPKKPKQESTSSFRPKWYQGKIRRLDRDKNTKQSKSGQVQVQYRTTDATGADKECLYWAHLDDPVEVQEFGARTFGGDPPAGRSGYRDSSYGGYNTRSRTREIAPHDYGVLKSGEKPVQHNYVSGNWLEVQRITGEWNTATIVEIKNNHIRVSYAELPGVRDDYLHIKNDQSRIRNSFQEDTINPEVEADLKKFTACLKKQQNMTIKPMEADGNCLYRAVAYQLFGDPDKYQQVREETCDYMESEHDFFQNFIEHDEGFEAAIAEKRNNFHWGNHEDISAMSERYNCKVKVYEYDSQKDECRLSLQRPDKENEAKIGAKLNQLPTLYLSRHRAKHYNAVDVGDNLSHKAEESRPIFKGGVENKSIKQVYKLRQLRVEEDKRAAEVARAAKEESTAENEEMKNDTPG